MRSDPQKASLQFLSGAGETGAFILSKDWRKTSLGEIDTWPQSLCTSLGNILSTHMPSLLFWEKGLACFYNAAFVKDTKHTNGPQLMGEPAEAVLPELFILIRPFVEQVLSSGQPLSATHPVAAKSQAATVYYSPVYGESGNVAGVIMAYPETPAQQPPEAADTSEERAKIAIEAANLGSFDLNYATGAHDFSLRTREIFGFSETGPVTREMIIGAFHRDDLEMREDAKRKGLASGFTNYDIRIVRPDGSIRWVNIRARLFYNALGEQQRTIGMVKDITEEHKKREILRSDEERFRNMVFQAPVGIALLRGRNFRVEMANLAYLELVAKEEKEIVGLDLFDALPEVKDVVNPLLTNVFDTGDPFYAAELEVILKRHGKAENAYFNLVYQPMRETNGDITGIMVIANEVTEQVKSKHDLAESEKEFRNVVMQSPIAMTVFRGDDFVIEMANRVMFKDIWRRPESDVIGKKLLDVFPELKTQQYPDLLRKVMRSGQSYQDKEAIAYVNGGDGMRKFYFDFEYAPLFDTDGKVSGLMVTVNDVTEKVEAREQLSNSAERLLLATEGTQLGTWDLNLKTFDIVHSPRLAEIFGHDRSKILLHKEMRKQIHTDDVHDIVEKAFENAMRTGTYFYEARVIHPDKTIRWLRTHGNVVFDSATKTPVRMLGTMMDITEQKLSKQKIEESEDRLKIVVEASELGTWDLNIQTDEVTYSQRYIEIFGHNSDEPLDHKQLIKYIHPDDVAKRNAALQKAYETGVLKNYEFRIIRTDGSVRWVEAKGRLFYDAQNKPFKLIGTVRDITDIHNAMQEIRESEQKFRLLADSMPQHIWTGDGDGNLNYFNQSIYDYSGLSPTQILKSGWMQIVHPDDRDESIKHWARSVNNGIPFLVEHRFKRSDGEYRWQLSRAVPQRDSAGNIQMWVGTSTDVHDQKTFSEDLERNVEIRTQELKRAIEELVKTNQELEQFAYVSSHDLQEPLRKIQTFSSLLLEKPAADPGSKLYLDKINSSASRMSDLIKDLLNYSRLSKTDDQFVDTDLNTILDSVKNDFEVLIKQKLAIIISTRLPVIRAIPIQMNQLIYNLIGNSLKFCDKKPFIELAAKKITAYEAGKIDGLNPEYKYYHLMLKDNGIGFSSEYKEQIFTIFQRLHEKQKYSGTGIGLAMCKKIVENHRGYIFADSEPGKGATFNIYLPY